MTEAQALGSLFVVLLFVAYGVWDLSPPSLIWSAIRQTKFASRDGSKTRESRRYVTEYGSEYFYIAALSTLPLETAAGVSSRF